MGRWRRRRVARSTIPKPRMGRELAVQETTTSNSDRRSVRSDSFMVLAENRLASSSARSAVRLATTMLRGRCAAKWVAHSSIISPAPMNSVRAWSRLPNTRSARRTAAAAMDTDCAPMAVCERTSLATEKVRWNIWCSSVPSAPASPAARTASFIWPTIWVSPSTMESSPLATRKAWRTASSCWWRYRCGRSVPASRRLCSASHAGSWSATWPSAAQ
ncbi:Uncharacterised protein [Achromobacter xylosoxidans]|nr:Uncharacterised protein [Achromobacter xylosoxidans]